MSEVEETEADPRENREGREPEVVVDEATAFPNRADPEHWDAISRVIVDLCKDIDGAASVDNMINCVRLHWHELVDADATKARADVLELALLETAVADQDAARVTQNERIDELKRRGTP